MLFTTKQEPSTLLELHHEDYSLYLSAPAYAAMRAKAQALIGEEALRSAFHWSEGAHLFVDDNRELEPGQEWTALFFENTDYQVEIDFHPKVTHASLEHPIFRNDKGEAQRRDTFMPRRHLLAFPLNFGNDIGKSHIEVDYTLGGEKRKLELRFDVLSVKLDYHQDMSLLLEDIEREYSMLSLSFLRKTYHTFATDVNTSDTPDLIWWNLFKGIQEEFCRAVELVIDRPHNRLRSHTLPLRADQLRQLTPALENALAEHRGQERHLYLTEQWQLNDDTPENRFVKYALRQITDRFTQLSHRIHEKHLGTLPQGYTEELDGMEQRLKRLNAAPFLRRIGRFNGLRGENLTLKQAAGYSTIYRDWLLLQNTYALHEGVAKMELKEISELYEIWCFIKVKNLVRELLGSRVEQAVPAGSTSYTSVPPELILRLKHGEQSKVLLHEEGVTLAEVIFNAQLDREGNRGSGMGKSVGSLTTAQRPDIVLRLSKDDVAKGIEMTYLFDAKYRIEVEGEHQMPPDDAINQMHRYRDAIYYSESDFLAEGLKREVLGGYILFPGKEPEDWESENYLRSISRVNIGAFPLRPGREGAKDRFLRQFLTDIIGKPQNDILLETIPQKGLRYQQEQPGEVVLVNYADESHWALYVEKGMCYLRTGDARGSIRLPDYGKEPRYLLLHNGKDKHRFYRLDHKGGRIFTRESLMRLGFNPSQEGIYLVYTLKSKRPVEMDHFDFLQFIRKGEATSVPHLEYVLMPDEA